MLRTVGLATAGAILLALTATACGDDGSEPGQPDDGVITVYSGRAEGLVGPLIAQFEAETGIDVDVRYGNTAQLAAQLQEEGDRSPADVFYAQDAGALGAAAKAGLFATLPDQVLAQVPEALRADDGSWIGVTGRSRVLVYNPELISEQELPQSVLELAEPQWAGLVGVAPTNGSFQAFVTGMRVQHGEDTTRQWLEGLANNDPQIRDGNVPIVVDVDAGRIAVGLVNHYYLYEQAKERGVPVEELTARNYVFPNGDIGAMVNVSGVGVLTDVADDPDVAAFIDYLLSQDGQTYFAEETSEYPLTGGITVPVGLPDISELTTPDIDLSDLDTLEQTVQMISESGLA